VYRLKVKEQEYLITNPIWVKQFNKLNTSTIISAGTETDAMGVRHNNTIYQLADKPLMTGDFETAELTYITPPEPEPYEPPEPPEEPFEGKYTQSERMGWLEGFMEASGYIADTEVQNDE